MSRGFEHCSSKVCVVSCLDMVSISIVSGEVEPSREIGGRFSVSWARSAQG